MTSIREIIREQKQKKFVESGSNQNFGDEDYINAFALFLKKKMENQEFLGYEGVIDYVLEELSK